MFYLHGEDHFGKDAAVRALVSAHLDEATRDFNLDRLSGTDVDPETMASILATPPMMAEWRVVVIREVEGLAASKHAREALLDVVKAPPPGLALVLNCTVPSGSKAKFYRELAKFAQAVEFRAFAEADVPGWIMGRAKDVHAVDFDVDAAQASVDGMIVLHSSGHRFYPPPPLVISGFRILAKSEVIPPALAEFGYY